MMAMAMMTAMAMMMILMGLAALGLAISGAPSRHRLGLAIARRARAARPAGSPLAHAGLRPDPRPSSRWSCAACSPCPGLPRPPPPIVGGRPRRSGVSAFNQGYPSVIKVACVDGWLGSRLYPLSTAAEAAAFELQALGVISPINRKKSFGNHTSFTSINISIRIQLDDMN